MEANGYIRIISKIIDLGIVTGSPYSVHFLIISTKNKNNLFKTELELFQFYCTLRYHQLQSK